MLVNPEVLPCPSGICSCDRGKPSLKKKDWRVYPSDSENYLATLHSAVPIPLWWGFLCERHPTWVQRLWRLPPHQQPFSFSSRHSRFSGFRAVYFHHIAITRSVYGGIWMASSLLLTTRCIGKSGFRSHFPCKPEIDVVITRVHTRFPLTLQALYRTQQTTARLSIYHPNYIRVSPPKLVDGVGALESPPGASVLRENRIMSHTARSSSNTPIHNPIMPGRRTHNTQLRLCSRERSWRSIGDIRDFVWSRRRLFRDWLLAVVPVLSFLLGLAKVYSTKYQRWHLTNWMKKPRQFCLE